LSATFLCKKQQCSKTNVLGGPTE